MNRRAQTQFYLQVSMSIQSNARSLIDFTLNFSITFLSFIVKGTFCGCRLHRWHAVVLVIHFLAHRLQGIWILQHLVLQADKVLAMKMMKVGLLDWKILLVNSTNCLCSHRYIFSYKYVQIPRSPLYIYTNLYL